MLCHHARHLLLRRLRRRVGAEELVAVRLVDHAIEDVLPTDQPKRHRANQRDLVPVQGHLPHSEHAIDVVPSLHLP
jgi:hypothetical protein